VWAIAAFFVIVSAANAAGATYQVGPGKPYSRFSDLPILAPGDVVEISSGTYREAMRWTSSGTAAAPITIRGVGATRPIIDGTGVGVSGVLPQPRALFQIEGDHVIVENIEFRNAHNSVGNGSGIRVIVGRSVVIRNVRITACDMGIMANGHDDLLVERSEIALNGAATGAYSHNVYIAEGGTTTFRFNYIHDSLWGLNFKSRSHFTQLLYNHIANSADGEVSLVDSISTDQANSHALMLGNLVVSKVRSPANNQAKFIDFGQDVGIPHRGVLYLVHNTLVAATPAIEFLWATSPQSSIVAEHNIFFGSNRIVTRPGAGTSGARNWLPSSATIPASWTERVTGVAPGFVNLTAGDYHLIAGSPAVDRATGPTPYFDGFGVARWAVAEFEYVPPMQSVSRTQSGVSNDVGAYEVPGGALPPPPPPPPSGGGSQAAFVGTDTTTLGAWQGAYGSQGYVLAKAGASLPAGRTAVPGGHATWTWASSTTDARALRTPAGTSRVAAAWYAASFVIDVQPGDADAHRLSLYLLDWDRAGRAQRMELLDGVSGAVLDTRTVSGFGNGLYAIWEVSGPVRIRVTRTAGPNAVVSAVFLDPVSSGSTTTATFRGTDTTTQGTWRGVYGTTGYTLAKDGTSLPAGVTVSRSGSQTWAWASTTSDPRALQKAATSGRIAAAWYGSSFTIDVGVPPGQAYDVSLYAIDWDTAARAQRIDVLDAASGAVLDTRTVTGFRGGQYWVWTVRGAVRFRVTRTAGANAVVSAAFLDPAS
jgi:hypothetical protein